MKKFTFSLKPVLDHRERIEEERRQNLAQCQRDLQSALDALAELNAGFEYHSRTLREKHRSFSTDRLRLQYAHLDFLDRAITEQERVVATHRNAFERARIALVEASQDRKAIEKLKVRKFAAHSALNRLLEQRESDDANARRYSRGQQLPGGLT